MTDYPDYSRAVNLRGHDGTTIRDIRIDTDGHLYALLEGHDGTQRRTIKVDEDGQLYMLMKGHDGSVYRDVLVDTAGNIISVMKGNDSGTLRTLAVDGSGQLYAMLRALYNSTATDLLCDSAGNLRLNIKAQDLFSIKSRPVYGTIAEASGAVIVAENTTEDIVEITGEGIILACRGRSTSAASHKNDFFKISIDAALVSSPTFNDLNALNLTRPWDFIAYKIEYDDAAWKYGIGMCYQYPFASSFKLEYTNAETGLGNSATASAVVYYALV